MGPTKESLSLARALVAEWPIATDVYQLGYSIDAWMEKHGRTWGEGKKNWLQRLKEWF